MSPPTPPGRWPRRRGAACGAGDGASVLLGGVRGGGRGANCREDAVSKCVGGVRHMLPSRMTTHRNHAKLLSALIALAWVSGCSDTSCVTCPPPVTTGLVVSDPVPAPVLSNGARGALVRADPLNNGMVFVSLAPGTAPSGSKAFVHRVGDAG